MRRNHCKTYMNIQIFDAGDTRLRAEGAETTVTYAKNCPRQKRGNRRDHSQILALGGPIRGLLRASWGHACKEGVAPESPARILALGPPQQNIKT